jgi:hypothetical protein
MNQLIKTTFSILCASVVCSATTAFAQTKDADFTSLFDGRTFTGWEHSGNWVIEGGAFYRKEKGGSLTYTAATVPDDFELRFEWKVSKGCNSGVYYRPGQVEYQILDNVHSPYGENARQAAASIFFCMAPSKDATKPIGEWNTGRILCKGTVIEHWLNGERVISFDYADPKWTDYVKLLGIRGGDLTGRGGRLWLQDHGQDVWYRALRWREIPTDERLTPAPAFKPLPVTGEALAKEQARVKRMLDAKKKPAAKPPNSDEAVRSVEPHVRRRFDFSVRASEIDPRAKEHPKIRFVFVDAKGKPQDLQHAVVDTRAASRGRRVIWLMEHNQGLFERISAYGLHGIQPHYANRWFWKLDATARDDGTTLGRIRLEAATGEDHSPLVTIPNPDSMAERSVQFVKWLAKENPEGMWDQFLTDDQSDLCWDKVIMSGISHGSTTAARFAKHQKVARVVMFSGPRDQFESWHGFLSATPANRYFGFTHVLDGGWTGNHYCRSWQMLGLAEYGPIVNVDEVAAPFGKSRRLIISSDVAKNPRRAHTTVVPGSSAVKNDQGEYIHEAVWRYLFTHLVDQTGKPVPLDPNCRIDQKK